MSDFFWQNSQLPVYQMKGLASPWDGQRPADGFLWVDRKQAEDTHHSPDTQREDSGGTCSGQSAPHLPWGQNGPHVVRGLGGLLAGTGMGGRAGTPGGVTRRGRPSRPQPRAQSGRLQPTPALLCVGPAPRFTCPSDGAAPEATQEATQRRGRVCPARKVGVTCPLQQVVTKL